MDETIWPDAQRGIHALLEGQEALGFEVVPSANPGRAEFDVPGGVVVHLESADSTEGDIERSQEIRITVYGPSVYQSKDIYEVILSYITGEGIETPAAHNWPRFFFDEIRRLRGPSTPNYPDDTIYPAMGTVLATARPMA